MKGLSIGMDIFGKIAEQRIREALDQGEFEGLAGQGRPLDLDDDPWVPEDLRMCYKVLRNAGCLPPELELRKEIVNLRELMQTVDDDAERLRRIRELDFKVMKLGMLLKRPLGIELFPEYEEKIAR